MSVKHEGIWGVWTIFTEKGAEVPSTSAVQNLPQKENKNKNKNG